MSAAGRQPAPRPSRAPDSLTDRGCTLLKGGEPLVSLRIEYGTLQAFSYLAGIFFFGEYKTMDQPWMWASGFSGLAIIICGVGVSSLTRLPWQSALVVPFPA